MLSWRRCACKTHKKKPTTQNTLPGRPNRCFACVLGLSWVGGMSGLVQRRRGGGHSAAQTPWILSGPSFSSHSPRCSALLGKGAARRVCERGLAKGNEGCSVWQLFVCVSPWVLAPRMPRAKPTPRPPFPSRVAPNTRSLDPTPQHTHTATPHHQNPTQKPCFPLSCAADLPLPSSVPPAAPCPPTAALAVAAACPRA